MKSRKGVVGCSSFRNTEKSKFNCKLGRKKSLSKEETEELFNVFYTRAVSFRELARMFRVSRMTVWRALNPKVVA